MIYLLLLVSSLSVFATSEIKCEATYDQMGITRQKVNSTHDYYYCFGYHHGRDRAWQMDYFKRVGYGRNAEIYGFSSLKGDLIMRLLDLPTLANRLWDEMPEEQKDVLKIYSRGVNQGFVEGKNAKEFKDLGYEPEEWSPVDSLVVLTLQSFDQTRKTFFKDYEEEKFKEHWKEKSEALFDEDTVPWNNTILKDGEYPKKEIEQKTTFNPTSPRPKLWANFPDVFGKESGSNNWVVSKQKSKSGFAMLANDPHLDLKTPLFWYWMNLESPDMKVIGASVPGMPVVVSGTNGKLAWGLTNAYINTADVVFIKGIKSDDIVSFRPTVKVKFGFMKIPFFLKSFEQTKDGAKIIPLELETDEKMVMRWTGFNMKGTDIAPMFEIAKSKTVEDMNTVLTKVALPAWNYVFADSKGDIGFRVVGNAYKEEAKDPFGISYETMEEFKAKPLLDPVDRPHVLNPKRNYIYTANNRHWPADAKYYGGRGYTYSFRGFRIDEMLREQDKHDVESFAKIQCDTQAVDARFFVEKLLKVADIPELKTWNFETASDSVTPSVYRRLMDLLMEGWQVTEFGLYHMLDQLDEKQKSEIMSFYKVAKDQVEGRAWGDFHRLTFAHLSGNKDWKFSPELPGLGDNHSVNPGSGRWDTDRKLYEQFSGASMRMIIVMKEKPEIHLSLPGLNRNYTKDQTQTPAWKEWHSCKYSKFYLE